MPYQSDPGGGSGTLYDLLGIDPNKPKPKPSWTTLAQLMQQIQAQRDPSAPLGNVTTPEPSQSGMMGMDMGPVYAAVDPMPVDDLALKAAAVANQSPDPRLNPNNNSSPAPSGPGFYQRLMKMAQNVPTIDYSDLIAQNEAGIRGAYRPQIKGIVGQNKRTKKEFNRNVGILEGIRQQDIGSYNRQINRQGNKSEAKGENLEKSQHKQIAAIDRAARRQVQQAKKHLTSIGQDTMLAGAIKDIHAQASAEKQAVYDAMGTEQKINTRQGNAQNKYLEGLQAGARSTGTNIIADLINQKTGLLANNRADINSLRGQMGGDIAQTDSALRLQEAQDQLAANQNVFGNVMDVIGMRQGAKQQNFQNQLAQLQLQAQQAGAGAQDNPLPEGIQNADAIIQQYITDPQQQQQASQLLSEYINSDQLGIGQTITNPDPNGPPTIKITPEYIAGWLRRKAVSEYGWKPNDPAMNYLSMAGQQYGNN